MYCDLAIDLLAEMAVRALPVTVGRRLLGFFTCTDISKCDGRDPAATYVGTVMTAASASDYVRFDEDFEIGRKLVARSPFSLLAVVDRKSRLLGFISQDSIARALHQRKHHFEHVKSMR
jgi:CBS-domain-containing membrane protein